MKDTKIRIPTEVQRVLLDMHQRCEAIATECGRTSDEYVRALESLVEALMTIFRLGGRVTGSPDDPLSLSGDSWIAYDVTFHAEYREDTPDSMLGTWSVSVVQPT